MTWLDFETRSAADLPKVGSYMYAAHPTTEVLCLAWGHEEEPADAVHLWHPSYPRAGIPEEGRYELLDLHDRVECGCILEAHNAFFERCVWKLVCALVLGWPEVAESQWRCSAAKAASFALPRNLKDAADALRLPTRKTVEEGRKGNRLMKKLWKPRKPRKAELRQWGFDSQAAFTVGRGYLWHEKPEELSALFEYCRQDVRVERAVSEQLRPLPSGELATWKLDQKINARGLWCDRALAAKCLTLAQAERKDADCRSWVLTGGDLTGTTKREELLAWTRSEGVALENTQADTLDELVASGTLPDHVEEVFRLWRSVNRTSVAKYASMLGRIAADGRIRDVLRYHGASTGRWAGAGIQPHNFPRACPDDMEVACRDVLELPRDDLRIFYGDVMELISGTLRGAIGAAPGHELLAADYSMVEARGTFWVSGDEAGLRMVREYDAGRGPHPYAATAAEVFHKDPKEIPKGTTEYQVGKSAMLGLGYQMGAPKFQRQCPVAISDELSARTVQAYRTKHNRVKRFWYDVEAAAIEAVRRGPGAPPVTCGRVAFAVIGRFLHCRLPSGRLLSYCDPSLEPTLTPWGDPTVKLRFWGVDTYSHKWSRQATYGGKLTENIVQALCRDLMRDAMHRAEARGYPVVLTVHDEVVSEVPEGFGSLKEFEAIVAEPSPWADGFPIVAEGWRGKRYRK